MDLYQHPKTILRRLLAAVGLTALIAFPASAQQAGRAITIIVPYTAGSGPDTLARLIGEELQSRWGQPVVVDNKPGASANIGMHLAARAAPDGHTIMMTANPLTNNVSLFKSLPYDPVKSFTPIIYVGEGTLALAVHPSLPVKNVREFIDYAKGQPGKLNYGSPGVGTPHHLAMELFKLTTKIDLTHIPYRGTAGSTQDLVGGHVTAGFQAIHVIRQMAEQGQVRLLGAASKQRSPVAPDVPTLAEQGLADFEVATWYGLLGPAGLPPEMVTRYNKSIGEILATPSVIEKLAKQGLVVSGGTPETFAAFIGSETAKWQKVVKDAGLPPIE